MLFSLVMATYGRSSEVARFLESLRGQEISERYFEVIIVDQNDQIDLSEIVSKYSSFFRIKHIKSSRKGLSYNRNIGLLAAAGEYVCFPDDDCTYYPDTLSKVLECFKRTGAFAIFGAIRDRQDGRNIIKEWPKYDCRLTRSNFFMLYSSITVFCKRSELDFDEKLGVGEYFGSCEDTDYVYSMILNHGNCFYCGDLEVWHPPQSIQVMGEAKNYSYGLGFGAFCAKYSGDIFIMKLFLMSLAYHALLALLALAKMDGETALLRKGSFISRVRGFLEYKKS
ncbi:glycosyltransferase family 2 protein [Pseudomonas flexibilis]|uniref:Glycosyltransferase, GT2 family n=1 Tax=Pseudomonas flexibilis TaxID=706570 RepID=A0A1N6WY47_9PSED|nr:glycosyltransferase family 2 protein [Pseudomonas flexibilis]SIQ94978.1 Glycosyltransferase, GT2 family [Pseudomonas flexibilis]